MKESTAPTAGHTFISKLVHGGFVVLLVVGTSIAALQLNRLFLFNPPAPVASPSHGSEVGQSARHQETIVDNWQPSSDHPVERLVHIADLEFKSLIHHESIDLASAAVRYRRKRGRHPPPGFDKWFHLARSRDAVVAESLFDQIYDDLEPLWAVNPWSLRNFTQDYCSVISVRNGKPYMRDEKERSFIFDRWMFVWMEIFRAMGPLPDVDMAFTLGDEPRVMAPFQTVVDHVRRAKEQRKTHMQVPLTEISNEFPHYANITYKEKTKIESSIGYEEFNEKKQHWDHIMAACKDTDSADNPANRPTSDVPPSFSTSYADSTDHGYVANFTAAKSICQNPRLRTLQGHIISPVLGGVYTSLVPIFSVAKLTGVSNDIVVPTPDHWDQSAYRGLETTIPWSAKSDSAVWRGSATGGQHNASNWFGFQRHRFIAMNNATTLSTIESELASIPSHSYADLVASDTGLNYGAHIIPYPSPQLYDLSAQRNSDLPRWTASVTDIGFTAMYCDPMRNLVNQSSCWYTDDYFSNVSSLDIHQVLHHKYLPDIDGQTTSGRYRGFLRSLSVPIKASVFSEWFDRRLVAWKHFVPMSVEMGEWWGLMEYFVGYNGTDAEGGEVRVEGHDAVAEKIGREGSEWAEKVVRRDDMMLYLYRVVLEYARVQADERDRMGWVEDLLDNKIDVGG